MDPVVAWLILIVVIGIFFLRTEQEHRRLGKYEGDNEIHGLEMNPYD